MVIATIASQQVQALRRQRVFAAFVIVVVAMTVAAGVIGWSSHNTIVRVYEEAVALLSADGKAAPPNPFELVPPLSLLSNMAIYVPLIGSLLALIVGHLSLADDQAGGVGRLIFSREVPRSSYLAGKLLATATVVAAAVAASLAVSVVALRVANGTFPTAGDLGRLVLFYALSWLYLMAFVLVGMTTVLLTTRRSLALLTGLGVWLVVTFAMPQFTSGLRPTTSLNPVTSPVSTSQTFFAITSKIRPLSISEQYKSASAHILGTGTGTDGSALDTIVATVPLLVLVIILSALAFWLVRRHDYSRSTSDD